MGRAANRPNARSVRAAETRERIVRSAGELFTAQGYGATTLQDVAKQAGVSIQTVYFVFGNKRSLLKEVVDSAIAGDLEPVPTMQREWFLHATAAPTARELLARYVRGATAILHRTAPIVGMVSAAAAIEPEVAELWQPDLNPRYQVTTEACRALLRKPDARPGLRLKRATDIMYGLLSPELFTVFTSDRGWSERSWQLWATDTLARQLCTASDGAGS